MPRNVRVFVVSLGCLLLGAAVATFLPLGEGRIHATPLASPSWPHVLGSDVVGRDNLERTARATWNSMVQAILVVVVSAMLGYAAALVSTIYRGTFADRAIELLSELLRAFPALIGAIVLVSLGIAPFLVVTTYFAANIWRVSTVLLREEEGLPYVLSAQMSGLSRSRAVAVEASMNVVPRMSGALVLTFSEIIAVLETMAFLGVGRLYEVPTLGSLLRDAFQFGLDTPLSWLPALCVLLALPFGLIFSCQTLLAPRRTL